MAEAQTRFCNIAARVLAADLWLHRRTDSQRASGNMGRRKFDAPDSSGLCPWQFAPGRDYHRQPSICSDRVGHCVDADSLGASSC